MTSAAPIERRGCTNGTRNTERLNDENAPMYVPNPDGWFSGRGPSICVGELGLARFRVQLRGEPAVDVDEHVGEAEDVDADLTAR